MEENRATVYRDAEANVAAGFRLRAKRFGETRRSLGGGGQPARGAEVESVWNELLAAKGVLGLDKPTASAPLPDHSRHAGAF